MIPIAAPADQAAAVFALSKTVAELGQSPEGLHCELALPAGERIAIPESVFHILARVAEVLARGDAVSIVRVGKEITTREAADLLNVSHEYFVRLLDDGSVPFTMAGKHRHVCLKDLLHFKAKRDEGREAALAELTELSDGRD